MDFTDLNTAYLKDCFHLSWVDQLVDGSLGQELLSFMDAFSGYNLKRMSKKDEEKIVSITRQQHLLLSSNVIWVEECKRYLPEGG